VWPTQDDLANAGNAPAIGSHADAGRTTRRPSFGRPGLDSSSPAPSHSPKFSSPGKTGLGRFGSHKPSEKTGGFNACGEKIPEKRGKGEGRRDAIDDDEK
jgi:hypothetical protein